MSAVVLQDLVPELQRLFEAYLEAEPDGDRETFASWVADEIPGLEHAIDCSCDCHANAAVFPGPHCEACHADHQKMTLREFVDAVKAGAYTDDDGSARLGTDAGPVESPASIGTVLAFFDSKSTRLTHVYWYNK